MVGEQEAQSFGKLLTGLFIYFFVHGGDVDSSQFIFHAAKKNKRLNARNYEYKWKCFLSN